MKLWSIFSDWLESDGITAFEIKTPSINPANGLPMLEGGAIDIHGNPFGTDALDHSGPDFSGWTDDL